MASSAQKLIPSDPDKVTVSRNVTPTIKTFSAPFLRFGLIKVGGRGTIVQLRSGNLAVFSPVALTEGVKKEIAAFGNGRVKYITALDQEHHIFLSPWHDAYPEAIVIGPETLEEYRKKQGYPTISQQAWKGFPKSAAAKASFRVSEEFDQEFEYEYVSAHANQELVFNHKPTRTLIEADYLFNLPATEQFSRSGVDTSAGLMSKLFNALNNTQGSAVWQKRFIWYAISAGDRKGFNASTSRIAQWDFDRIIPCHGDVIEKGAKGIFEKVFSWHLEAARKGH
ncbi:hypothetical protein LTR62_003673 [Meristemomyces frigidus]|uniref:Uncharacterized protein n=1 Tax=Meristemomyces frigidus TaxID=1508187 RepID=A0AAN7THF1_9PEZI|nr:hypothetical protein LTR62_003673 [Meristemomyces frigidus]